MDALCDLKDEIILDYTSIITRLLQGYQDNIDNTVTKIMFVEVSPYLDNITSIYESLLNK